MKKVSELINLKNLLLNEKWKFSVEEFTDRLDRFKSNIEFVKTSTGIDHLNLTAVLDEIKYNTDQSFGELDNFISEIDSLIRENDNELREMSIVLDQASNTDPPSQILEKISNREKTHHKLTKSLFNERCKLYSNWKYPGMQIRPGYGTWTRSLVDLDPLYLVDIHNELLEPAKNNFNEHYRSRLRFNTISDVDKPIFANLPNEQFGLIVATEFFNQKSLGTIKRYLKEIFSLLRSGGVFIFTFNNCNFPEGVINSENRYDCYTPASEVKHIAKESGFEIIDIINSNGTLSWAELRRPGKLKSLRGGQTLAKIKHKQKNN